MIVNPYKQRELMTTFTGTRLLQEDFGVIGASMSDPAEPYRIWSVHSLYAPVTGRSVGGIRAKLLDQKGVIAFINQMDLEILLGAGTPGKYCQWAGKMYPEKTSANFYGMVTDDDDLVDDLYDRELLMRGNTATGMLDPSSEIIRYVHLEERLDFQEYWILMWDGDPETGISPDIRMETVEKRWVRVERTRCPWDMIGL